MELELENKVALVTGSTRGIGRAIVYALLEEGARVVVTGRDRKTLDATVERLKNFKSDPRVLSYVGDLTAQSQIDSCVHQVIKDWGRIDILAANIGTGSGKHGWEADDDEWHHLLEYNLHAGIRIARAVIPHMIRSGEGVITFIASIAGIEATRAPVAYSAAKAALIHATKRLGRQLAEFNIRVNAVAPGNIHADGGVWDLKIKENSQDVMQYVSIEVPQKRLGKPEEVADVVTFLSSRRASFITGECIVVDGGQTRSI